ncbi:hypothetical protein [Streptomyces africanus]|uniref:hypothetical protein n=1 Tax=Streptomyces africanus TaxID=231024 RepID=UPI0027D7DE98|nr:hypothetical protein [Streptomyces africanus]
MDAGSGSGKYCSGAQVLHDLQGLLGLVAAGLGVTRRVRSSRSLRRTGVVFVPLKEAYGADIGTDLAATTDLTENG